MPELPEVETVRRGLVEVMEGHTVAQATARRPDLRWPLPDRFEARLTGARIDRLRRRSKYILADLSTNETLLMHLGMSGRIVVAHPGGTGAQPGAFHHVHGADTKHDHVIFDMEHGPRVAFNDPRRFGAMDIAATTDLGSHRFLAGLGPEPLGNAFGGPTLVAAFAGRRTSVKAALLDQRIVAGLGNIYVCEALHRAGIAPRRAAGRISAARIETLATAIREVLRDAIAAGGSSLRDYRQADGELGYFQHAFRVYGREGERCPRPDCAGVVRRVVQSGRSSFYCPRCQR